MIIVKKKKYTLIWKGSKIGPRLYVHSRACFWSPSQLALIVYLFIRSCRLDDRKSPRWMDGPWLIARYLIIDLFIFFIPLNVFFGITWSKPRSGQQRLDVGARGRPQWLSKYARRMFLGRDALRIIIFIRTCMYAHVQRWPRSERVTFARARRQSSSNGNI